MTWHLIPLRAATLLEGPVQRIRYSLNRVDVWQRAAGAMGMMLTQAKPGEVSWADGEILKISATKPHPLTQPGAPGSHRIRTSVRRAIFGSRSWIARMDVIDGLPMLTVLTGPAAGACIRLVLGPTAAGTVVTAELVSTSTSSTLFDRGAALLQAARRPAAVLALRTLLGILTLTLHENAVVVGAAIIRDGQVLAARRTYPAKHAGKWELPGGKVEPGESDEQALTREVAEELGVQIRVGQQIGPDIALDVELVLRIYAASIDAGEPEASEHDSLQWVGPAELAQLDWLDGDRALLDYLVEILAAP